MDRFKDERRTFGGEARLSSRHYLFASLGFRRTIRCRRFRACVIAVITANSLLAPLINVLEFGESVRGGNFVSLIRMQNGAHGSRNYSALHD